MTRVEKGSGLFDNLEQRKQLGGLTRLWQKRKVEVIRKRDSGACIYCGLPGDAIDHVLPVRFGGPTITANGVVACRECNFQKGSKLSLGFISYAFAHLLRSGEDMSWVGKFWEQAQVSLNEALTMASTIEAGQHWVFPVVRTRSARTRNWRSTNLARAHAARAAVAALPGKPYPEVVKFAALRHAQGLPLSIYHIMENCDFKSRQTARKQLGYLLETGKWRERGEGKVVLLPEFGYRAGRPIRIILPVLAK